MKIVVLLVLINTIFTVRCEHGQFCQTSEGINGICTTIESFHDGEVYVCCNSTLLYKVGDISKQKCSEYHDLERLPAPGVVGGVKAGRGEFPHMVALGYGNENNIKWKCGGSLISENYVLTAAHCLYAGEDGNVTSVRAGTLMLQSPEETSQDFRVAKMIPHPDYEPPSAYHDIALIKLDRLINNTESVRPACLGTTFEFNANLLATGWGHLYSNGDMSNDLMKVNLMRYSNHQCNITFSTDKRNFPNGIQERLIICAGGEENQEKDTCQGDSGGPLQVETGTYHTIVGVTSIGKQCAIANIPSVYTRVSNYLEWIEKIVWDKTVLLPILPQFTPEHLTT